jgi:hypothetical protein
MMNPSTLASKWRNSLKRRALPTSQILKDFAI